MYINTVYLHDVCMIVYGKVFSFTFWYVNKDRIDSVLSSQEEIKKISFRIKVFYRITCAAI